MAKKVSIRLMIGFAFAATLILGIVAAGAKSGSLSKTTVAVNSLQNAKELTGDWTASVGTQKWNKSKHGDDAEWNDEAAKPERDKSNKLHLNFEVRNETNRNDDDNNHRNRHQIGQSYDFSDLQGLSREQALSGGSVKFSLTREAGSIACEGSFQSEGNQMSRGSGTFRFTPNMSFLAAMKSRGFDFEQDLKGRDDIEDRLFTATALNITTALADDLSSSGFGKLSVEDLFKAAIFKVDSKFMREMKASGFPNLGMEDLVKARIFKIDANFVTQVSQMGFDKEPFESLVKMQIFKVTPQFISEVRNEGFGEISVEELVKMRIFKIDSDYIRRARAEGVPMDVERLVQRKIGVGRQ
ncbi:MAG TPA: hypothetical protein VN643_01110 [Pyrinomonadaceae bacterium]|nr:hypothetical protein [Pyrinomonadaceae bacterium]